MEERAYQHDGVAARALYSDDGAYRYLLARTWDAARPPLVWIMLNPSTATERHQDFTIARCEKRTRALDHGGFVALNLFAFRTPDPRELFAAPDPVGPDNDRILRDVIADAPAIACAWGNHGARLGRAAIVRPWLRASGRPLLHLGLTKTGEPRHPLHLAYAVPLVPWII